jgi:hypothetical protein
MRALGRRTEPDEVVVEVDVHGLPPVMWGLVGVAGAGDVGGAPLPLEGIAVNNSEVRAGGRPAWVVIFFHVEVDLGTYIRSRSVQVAVPVCCGSEPGRMLVCSVSRGMVLLKPLGRAHG